MDITKILIRKYPNTIWELNGDEYENLNWLDETPQPTFEELETLWADVKNEIKIEQEVKAAARQSALAKLAELGLTEEEIAAL